MILKHHAEIVIKNSPESIWDYANDPDNWTASNAGEHLGLKYYNTENRPKTGTEFYQKESVAGVYADLRGQILFAERPRLCVWAGVAKYRYFGMKIRVPEGGVIQILPSNDGNMISHDYYMDFPDTIFGKLANWYFRKILNGQEALISHGQRELDYFKKRLEE